MGLKVVYHKRSRKRPAVGSLKMFSKVWAGCRKPAGPGAAHGQVRWADGVRGTGFLGGSPRRRQLGGSALTPLLGSADWTQLEAIVKDATGRFHADGPPGDSSRSGGWRGRPEWQRERGGQGGPAVATPGTLCRLCSYCSAETQLRATLGSRTPPSPPPSLGSLGGNGGFAGSCLVPALPRCH